LIIAPVFFSAFDYAVLGMAITRLGPQFSILQPMWYFIIFITADLVSLILQAVGGAQASQQSSNGSPTLSATHIMVAGIIFQLISMGLFIILLVDFMARVKFNRPYAFQERFIARKVAAGSGDDNEKRLSVTHTDSDTTPSSSKQLEAQAANGQNLTRWWILMAGVLLSSVMIIIRGVYRSDELWQGWSGYLIEHQIYQVSRRPLLPPSPPPKPSSHEQNADDSLSERARWYSNGYRRCHLQLHPPDVPPP